LQRQPGNARVRDLVGPRLAEHLGYYMADEPTSDKHDRLRGFVDQVKALDPD
jgi:hypothetical protein